MNSAITDFQRAESLVKLMEKGMVYLNPGFGPRDLSVLTGVPLRHLENSSVNVFGLSLSRLIEMYRIQYSRNLLISGVSFKNLNRYSGFGSFYSFKRALEHIVY